MAKKKTKTYTQHINFWAMIQNVLIAAMNKGQLPAAALSLLLIILLLKTPSSDISALSREILLLLKSLHLLGWTLTVVLAGGWYWNSKNLRRMHANEMSRMSVEKKQLQSKATGLNLGTSN